MVEAARQLAASMSAFGLDITEEQVCVIPKGSGKRDALELMINAVGHSPNVLDVEALRAAVYEREDIQSTGIGEGIAVPHVRIPEVTEATLGVGIAPSGIPFDTIDNKPVHVLVLFATPAGATNEYLSLLAQVMVSLRNQDLFDGLVACKTSAEVIALLNQ